MPAIGKNADALQSFPRMKKLCNACCKGETGQFYSCSFTLRKRINNKYFNTNLVTQNY